jgi:hypothetical protein
MQSDISESSVYTALRQEMTQTLFAFRQLLIGELAAYAALIGGLLTIAGAKDVYAFTFPAVVFIYGIIAFLIVTTTVIGHTWLGTVFRQGSYILVAFELPLLLSKGAGSKDRGKLWIMANRAEAFRKGQHFAGRKVNPGTDVQSFVVRQIGLFVLSSLILAIIVPARRHDFFASGPSFVDRLLIGFAVVVAVVTVVALVREFVKSRNTLAEHVRSWVAYVSDRKKFDDALLESYGIDKAALEKMYGEPPAATQQQKV